ncbi:MAG TPA: hypothetical protein VHZ73_05235, partial [Vicinamibacterales bacterium]|nr:hypothetical protein [Vicinamibacterales bacterium]
MQTSIIRRSIAVAVFAIGGLLAAQPAHAQHRARLSADLADAIKTGSTGVDVIVHGSKTFIDATAARHGLKVKRYMKSGAVFHVNAGQLFVLQQDETLDHLSADVRIKGSDVTTDTIEAGDVWAGTGVISKATGAGIGVALIDSGVDFNHASLK